MRPYRHQLTDVSGDYQCFSMIDGLHSVLQATSFALSFTLINSCTHLRGISLPPALPTAAYYSAAEGGQDVARGKANGAD